MLICDDTTIPILGIVDVVTEDTSIGYWSPFGFVEQKRKKTTSAVLIQEEHVKQLLRRRFISAMDEGQQYAEVWGNVEPGDEPGTVKVPFRLCGAV
jgi:hypothetical protein